MKPYLPWPLGLTISFVRDSLKGQDLPCNGPMLASSQSMPAPMQALASLDSMSEKSACSQTQGEVAMPPADFYDFLHAAQI